jgi:hypothetical protein
VSLLDLRRQLHAAWVRHKRGVPGSTAAHELAVRRWFEGLSAASKEEMRREEDDFQLEHWKTAGRSLDACDPATCPYGS